MIIIVLKFLLKINIDISEDISEETLHDIKASRSGRALPSSRRSYCDRETGSVPARRKFGGWTWSYFCSRVSVVVLRRMWQNCTVMAQKMLAMNSAREATRDNSPLACILSFLVSHICKKYLNKYFMFMCMNKQDENRNAIDSVKKIYLYIHMYMQN